MFPVNCKDCRAVALTMNTRRQKSAMEGPLQGVKNSPQKFCIKARDDTCQDRDVCFQ